MNTRSLQRKSNLALDDRQRQHFDKIAEIGKKGRAPIPFTEQAAQIDSVILSAAVFVVTYLLTAVAISVIQCNHTRGFVSCCCRKCSKLSGAQAACSAVAGVEPRGFTDLLLLVHL